MGLDERYNKSFSVSGLQELQIWRHVVQLITFIVLNGKLFGLASTVIIVPYLQDIQSPWSTVHGAYESLEYTVAKGMFPLLVLGVIYLTAATVGRVFCGWACPFGMIQDFFSYLPFKKQRLSTSTAASLRDVKWAIVAFSVLLSVLVGYRRATYPDLEYPVGFLSDSPFSVLSPASTLTTYVPWMILWKDNVLTTAGIIGWLKMGFLLAVLAPSVFFPRFFCRFLCPLGALMEPLSKYKGLRILRSPKLLKEDLNKVLADVCPMGVQVQAAEGVQERFIDAGGCIHCGKCITETPRMLSQQFVL